MSFSIKDSDDLAPQGLTRDSNWGTIYNALLDVIHGGQIFFPFDAVSDMVDQLSSPSCDTIATELCALFYDRSWDVDTKRIVLKSYFNNDYIDGTSNWLQTILRSVGTDLSFIVDSRIYNEDDYSNYNDALATFTNAFGAFDKSQFGIVLDVDSTTPQNAWNFVEVQARNIYGWRLKGFLYQLTSIMNLFLGVESQLIYFYENNTLCTQTAVNYVYDASTKTQWLAVVDDDNQEVTYNDTTETLTDFYNTYGTDRGIVYDLTTDVYTVFDGVDIATCYYDSHADLYTVVNYSNTWMSRATLLMTWQIIDGTEELYNGDDVEDVPIDSDLSD